MYATTDTQSALTRFLYRRRDPAWMQARIVFNVFRLVLGIVIISQVPRVGPLAWLGAIPLAWAAVSFCWIYYVLHNDQSKPAPHVAR
jgi:hypothetical protein